MIWSKRRLVGSVAPYVVNPRMLELETAKKILAELLDNKNHEVEDDQAEDGNEDALRSGTQFMNNHLPEEPS